ncbi:MAG: site-specific DNA-methyltransferase [Candidatus Lokiarchaeota archaeon]|nr:site-specific DNA-methyltransferase [Candidatus Harpocratesius repetitus]
MVTTENRKTEAKKSILFSLPELNSKILKSHELKENTPNLLKQKIPELQETLECALNLFSQLDLAGAAKNFRKLATDLKFIQGMCSTEGNMHPRNTLNDLTGKQWLQHTKSWLIVDGRPKDMAYEIKNHPASYPPALAAHFIEFFTKKGQWVFDPFMGIGSTAEACIMTQRNCYGTELNPDYANYTKERVNRLKNNSNSLEPSNKLTSGYSNAKYDHFSSKCIIQPGDAKKAVKYWRDANLPLMDFLITSPPYWNMLHTTRGGVKSALKQRVEKGLDEVYSENEADLGNIFDLTEYLDKIQDYFRLFKPMLRSGAYLMVIVQNCRPKDGIMVPLAWKIADRLKDEYILRQEFIWCQDQKFLGIWGYPTTYVSNVHHHYCLVFQNKN